MERPPLSPSNPSKEGDEKRFVPRTNAERLALLDKEVLAKGESWAPSTRAEETSGRGGRLPSWNFEESHPPIEEVVITSVATEEVPALKEIEQPTPISEEILPLPEVSVVENPEHSLEFPVDESVLHEKTEFSEIAPETIPLPEALVEEYGHLVDNHGSQEVQETAETVSHIEPESQAIIQKQGAGNSVPPEVPNTLEELPVLQEYHPDNQNYEFLGGAQEEFFRVEFEEYKTGLLRVRDSLKEGSEDLINTLRYRHDMELSELQPYSDFVHMRKLFDTISEFSFSDTREVESLSESIKDLARLFRNMGPTSQGGGLKDDVDNLTRLKFSLKNFVEDCDRSMAILSRTEPKDVRLSDSQADIVSCLRNLSDAVYEFEEQVARRARNLEEYLNNRY